jgi:hypothetical protein
MYYVHLGAVKAVMQMRVEEAQCQAESARLLQQAGFEQQSWLSYKLTWLLVWLGHGLVLLGRRLERQAVAGSSV